MRTSAISLFAGAGGMDVGFKAAGFDIAWANDINADACATYAANHGDHIEQGDLDELLPKLRRLRGIDAVFGGPPCQGFSVAGKMDPSDPRSRLLFSYMKVVEVVKPRAFVLENVAALGRLEKWRPFREMLFKRGRELGYTTAMLLLNAADYNVPQSRERVFYFGFRDLPELRGIEEALRARARRAQPLRKLLLKLGRAGSKENSRTCSARVTIAAKPVLRRSPYAGMLFNGQGRPLNPDGYSSTLPATMGGNRTPIIDEAHLYDGEPSWVEWYHGKLMRGDDPLPFDGAPERLRRLTVDEAIRIQTFPHDYDFKGRQSAIYTQIGNAVPCNLAAAVAATVLEGLQQGGFARHIIADRPGQLRMAV